ncbi:MAG: MFS transporter [Anaerolineales bacterium]|nr:MFS transporter [Anaerolineales bacterium]
MDRIRETFNCFSPKFWVLVLSQFIDRLGGTIIFPFFSLYITQKFAVGMTEAGALLGSFATFSFAGSMIGGALADRFGRKGMVIFGLVFSAISSIAFGLINEFWMFFVMSVFVGLLSDIAGPAHQAMVADLLPEEHRAQGYGIMRVSANLAWIIGPVIGGLLAGVSYLLLFVLDAISSLIVAGVVLAFIPETKPETAEDGVNETLATAFKGYLKVAKDSLFMAFMTASIFINFAYGQIYNTLSVYLRDVHGVPAQGYGLLMSANATAVVLLQFWISAKTRKFPPLLMMALGTGFYLVGFAMYGFVAGFALFLAAMLFITVGEMIVLPLGQALVAKFAPDDMRGRYMAFFGFSWLLSAAIGPGLSGMILDGPQPEMLWFLCVFSCLIGIVSLVWLHRRGGVKFASMEPAEA